MLSWDPASHPLQRAQADKADREKEGSFKVDGPEPSRQAGCDTVARCLFSMSTQKLPLHQSHLVGVI